MPAAVAQGHTLGHEAADVVDAGGLRLHHLQGGQVLQQEAGATRPRR